MEEGERLRAENAELHEEAQRLRARLEQLERQEGPAPESRLRAALADQAATPEQLEQAIAGCVALVEEAQRELEAKRFRARRGAFERLHGALDAGKEVQLAEAIAEARLAGVDEEDVEKAEAKLTELRSLTPAQREAKAARELEAARKKQAFVFVKKDDAPGLKALLEGLELNIRWQDWKDHAGRQLWRCAQDLRARQVQEMLAPLLGKKAPRPPGRAGMAAPTPALTAPRASDAGARGGESAPAGTVPTHDAAAELADLSLQAAAPPAEPQAKAYPAPTPNAVVEATPQATREATPEALANEEQERLKARALRAVAQDDSAALIEVLQCTPSDLISTWQNKAGKDLLTLSEERGSSGAYSVLARAMGIMREIKREPFEDRESVWVFVQGDVQPRRATVMEDTPEEADQVLLEFWDGDNPPELVERCLVRRMWS